MPQALFIGDIHEHPGARNADRMRSLDQIITEGLQLPDLGVIGLLGDVFHAKSDSAGRNAMDERLQRLAAVAPVLVIYGNHDEPGDLDGFARLKAKWPIRVYSRADVVLVPLATGQTAAVFVLPYPHKAGLVGAGVAAGEVVSAAADVLDPIFMAAAVQLEDARAAGFLTFMMAHANIDGARASTGQPQIGREISVTRRHLDHLGPILKVFGHIHNPQEISGAHFVGSICRLDFGETEAKRYFVADVDRHSAYTLESRPIDVAPMWHIEGTLTRAGFQFANDEDSQRVTWAGCDVRCRYTYKASDKAVLDESVIRALFASALRLKVESVADPDRELRNPEVAAARTLPEKLAAYRKEPSLPASVAEKVAMLEQLQPEMLLGIVAEQLAAIERPREVMVAA